MSPTGKLPPSGNRPAAALQAELQQIVQLLQAGQLASAAEACARVLARVPGNPAALHLEGLIREQSGDPAGGAGLIAQSIELEPGNVQFRLNLASVLRRRGRLPEAAQAYRQTLSIAPHERAARHGLALTLADSGEYAAARSECLALLEQQSADADAWTLLAYIHTAEGQLPAAENAYRRSLAIDSKRALVHHNLGSVLSRMERAEEALAALDRAQVLGLAGFELLFNRARTLALLYRFDEAEAAFAEALALMPAHIDAQVNLARLRFMRGDPDFARNFAAAAVAYPDNLALQASFATVLKSAGQSDLAEQRLRQVLRERGPIPELRSVLAQVLHEAGHIREAESEAMAAAAGKPTDSSIIETLVLILLSRGRPEDALPFIDTQRRREPLVQSWLAYEATAARLLGRDTYRELYDYARLVRVYELEAPRGWSSIGELNAALLEVLRTRHRVSVHPLDQSLRHGSQTSRNLLAESDTAIKAVLGAFEAPIAAYLRELGTDAAHPLSARNSGRAAIGGAWSVQLYREGFHVNHLHPQGWISSAYYVDVPDEVHDETLKSGWLKFGETRYPVPGATPERYIKPVPGRLVLFPSYMWHGTNPIHGGRPRTSIAFDAVPGA